MLLGRDSELATLERLLDGARRGRSAHLVVHGDPGVGKTVLINEVAKRASDFRVLTIRPLESESELPFAGVADLMRPILHLIDRIPEPQAEALSGAIALGPPTPGDRFAVAAATLSMLASAAERRPLLAIVDDAHWLDAPSREAVVFSGRRLSTEGVVLILAMRDRPWLAPSQLTRMPLSGLSGAAADALVDRARPHVSAEVRDRLVAETGGNPLAILESLAALNEEELTGRVPLTRPIPLGANTEAAFSEQVLDLSEPTRRALLLAAASDSADLFEAGRALAAAGLATFNLEPAERRGLIALESGWVEFKHPLVRSATYQLHRPDERRAAHRAIAGAIDASQPDRIAWHLAAAATGPDEAIAAALEQAGASAMTRRAHAAAARALELAGQLSPAEYDRARRLLAAANAALFGNDAAHALAILDGLLARTDEPSAWADIQSMRGAALTMRQPIGDTHRMLVDAASRTEPHDPTRAAALLVQAYYCSAMAGATGQALSEAARSVELTEADGGPVAVHATAALGITLVMIGEVVRGRAILERLRPQLGLLSAGGDASPAVWAGMGFVLLEEWDTARALFQRVVHDARAAAAPAMLPLPLSCLSELEFRTGSLTAAYAAAAEAVDLCVMTGQDVTLPYAMQALARAEAVLGHDAACREHVDAALSAASRADFRMIEIYAPAALGLLELCRGRAHQAIGPLEAVARAERERKTTQSMVQWAGDLIESYVRCGRADDARLQLDHLAEEAEQTGQRWAAACVARNRGTLAADDDYEEAFEEALDIHQQDPSRFETARTQLCLGRRRRRARRRGDARRALHAALDTFEALGAEPWAEQASLELRAAGEAPAPARDPSMRALTAQETQVALIVADGATNNEAAAALFLSTKTVEFHLRNIYRKLAVRSRSELARKVALAQSGLRDHGASAR